MLGYSFVASLLIALLVKVTVGFRLDPENEVQGIDEAEHAESAYEFSTLRGGVAGAGPPRTAQTPIGGTGVPATAGKEG